MFAFQRYFITTSKMLIYIEQVIILQVKGAVDLDVCK